MKQKKRLPFRSLVFLIIIAAGVTYAICVDVDIPAKALTHIKTSISNLLSSMRLLPQSVSTYKEDPIPHLINASNPITEQALPNDLVFLSQYCDQRLVRVKADDIQGERRAVDALMSMLEAATNEGIVNWQVSEGFRTLADQQTLWEQKLAEYAEQGLSVEQANTATAKYVALPGYSEHHTGLAFDMTIPGELFPLTPQCAWLAENCWEYGFIIRYTEEKQAITGINAEPWHIRYVGWPHASIMREQNWCLEEYIESLSQ